MKFGIAAYALNIQYGGDYDLPRKLRELRAAGCSGIERLEAADSADAIQKAALFHTSGMNFATCRGPRTDQNLLWSAAFGKKYIWLTPGNDDRGCSMDDFCRRANRFLAACVENRLDGALHNHLGARIQDPDELDYFLAKCPDAKLLFDVGHFYGAGGDALAALKKYYPRLAGIHLKEIIWLDRSLPSDANWQKRLAFCGLGVGDGSFDCLPLLDFLREKNYSGWLQIEPDFRGPDLVEEMRASLDFVERSGFVVDGRR